MWWADLRGHHGKRWDYEPGDYYMGRNKKKREHNHPKPPILHAFLVLDFLPKVCYIIEYDKQKHK